MTHYHIDQEIPTRIANTTIKEIEYARPGRQPITITENRGFNDGTIHRIELTRRNEKYTAEVHTSDSNNAGNLLHKGKQGRISRLCIAGDAGVIADYNGTHGLLAGWNKKPKTAAAREICELLNDLAN